MSAVSTTCTYFTQAGPVNTGKVLDLVSARAQALGVDTILVATTTGHTGVLAAEALKHVRVVAVTHSTGFHAPGTQELTLENRAAIEAAGAQILTCQHAFGGVGRAVRRKLNTYQVEEIVAFTLRTFCEGIKVVAEICLMAADAGLTRSDEPVIAIAGTGRGADTAALMMPVHAQDFLDLRFLELICMPSPRHPDAGGGA